MKALLCGLVLFGISSAANAQFLRVDKVFLPAMECKFNATGSQFILEVQNVPAGYRDLRITVGNQRSIYRVSEGGSCLALSCPSPSNKSLSDDNGNIKVDLIDEGATGSLRNESFTCNSNM